MTEEHIAKLALARAHDILEAWWYEDVGENQYEYGLTDEQMNELLEVPFNIILAGDE